MFSEYDDNGRRLLDRMAMIYLLLFFSFLVNTKVLAVTPAMKTNVCALAATSSSEKDLFTSQPEDDLLQMITEAFTPLVERNDKLVISIQEIVHFKGLMDYLKDEIQQGREISYREYGIIPNYKGNFATFIFQRLLQLYELVLLAHDNINNDTSRQIVDVYQRRMIFLLSDKDKGVDINATENGISLLMIAASRGHDDIVNILIQRGADLSYQAESGRFQGQTVLQITRSVLTLYDWNENYSTEVIDKDPEHIRVKKIERYNRIIQLLEEAGAA